MDYKLFYLKEKTGNAGEDAMNHKTKYLNASGVAEMIKSGLVDFTLYTMQDQTMIICQEYSVTINRGYKIPACIIDALKSMF